METRPARAPLSTMVRSVLPNRTRAVAIAASRPPAAARLVLTMTWATLLAEATSEIFSSEPPLKPNQPIHRMKIPRVDSGRRSEEHTSELQSRPHLVCRLLLEKKKK